MDFFQENSHFGIRQTSIRAKPATENSVNTVVQEGSQSDFVQKGDPEEPESAEGRIRQEEDWIELPKQEQEFQGEGNIILGIELAYLF